MGCGCGRRKNPSRAARLSAIEKANRLASSRAKINNNKAPALSEKLLSAIRTKRMSICDHCPHSTPNKQEKKLNIRICHKVNRHISSISSDYRFKCPLGKFKDIIS